MYDAIVIGAGVVGSAVARELSRYNCKACVIEKEVDVCCGTSKANSGIVHAGYDAKQGSLKAKLNLAGNKMMRELSEELDFAYENTGSFVVCTKKEEIARLEELLNKGHENGIEGLEIITDRKRIFEMEPNLSDEVVAVLYAPTAGIVCPFNLNIALAENANTNGVEFKFNTEVKEIFKDREAWIVKTDKEDLKAKVVVNAAGVYADKIHNMVSEEKINIVPRKGEYYLLDKSEGNHVKRTIFALPNEYGKGVLVTPSAEGNLIIGPTAHDIEDKEGINTTVSGLIEVKTKAALSVKNIAMDKVITTFAGLRAHEGGDDFIIGEIKDAPGVFDCAGIESPGLTSAPAIGNMVANMIKEKLNLEENKNFNGKRKGITSMEKLSMEEYSQLINENPQYGNIICRCETVSEGQIVESINRPIGATTMDGVKRRTRAGLGRCQSGFCGPKVMEILARETGKSILEITKDGDNSKMLVGITK